MKVMGGFFSKKQTTIHQQIGQFILAQELIFALITTHRVGLCSVTGVARASTSFGEPSIASDVLADVEALAL